MMACKLLVLLICTAIFFCHVDTFRFNVSNIKKDIDFINSVQSSWKANFSSLSGLSLKEWKNKLGIRLIPKQLKKLPKKFKNRFSFAAPSSDFSDSSILQNYDLREAWPKCKSLISLIRDQSTCGSCWAVASASVLSDRFCIASDGKYNQPLSAEDLMRCCTKCKPKSGNGCDGGDVVEAMRFLYETGIVTGGEYNSENGCIPYSFKPCSSSNQEKESGKCAYTENGAETEKCQNKCSNPKHEIAYSEDKYFIADAFLVSSKGNILKQELMKSGSCIATMKVYEDFMFYKSGIYQYVKGKFYGNHGVRLIGWGKENGIEYWLVANSWGKSWGEDGVFKINRAKSGCAFGKYIICPVAV